MLRHAEDIDDIKAIFICVVATPVTYNSYSFVTMLALGSANQIKWLITKHSEILTSYRPPQFNVPQHSVLPLRALQDRAANSNLNSNSKKLGYFAELELQLEKIIFLNLNSNLNSKKIVRVRVH